MAALEKGMENIVAVINENWTSSSENMCLLGIQS